MTRRRAIRITRAFALWWAIAASPVGFEAAEQPRPSDHQELIVPPGGWVQIATPEEGAQLEASVGDGLLTPVEGGLHAPDSGDHWLTALSRDRAGNTSPLTWVRLRVDGESPMVELTWTPEQVMDDSGKAWLPPQSQVAAKAEDALAGVRETHLEGANQHAFGQEMQTISLPADGEVEVRAWAEDRVGNRSTTLNQVVFIDNVPPRGQLSLVGPTVTHGNILVAGPNTKITATVEDQESGLSSWTKHFDGGEAQTEDWQRPWSQGSHEAEVHAEDKVGNTVVLGPLEFEADSQGPEIQWRISSQGVQGENGEMFYLPPISLEISATDSPAGVAAMEWLQDDGAWARTESAQATVEAHGSQMKLRSEDLVTNRREETAAWNLDTEAPKLTLRLAGGEEPAPGSVVKLTEGSQLMAQAVDTGVGVASQEARLEPGLWTLAPQEFHLKTRGTYRLELRAEDRLGNRALEYWWLQVGSARK